MPEDWKVGKLGDIADVIMGQSPSGNSYNEKGIGCIFFQGRAEFGFRFPTIKLFTTEPKRIAKQNDILMSVRAPVGDFNVAYDDCCIGRGLCAIRSKDNFQSFILYTLWSVQNKLDVFNGEGTVFGSINKDSLNNLEIIVPDTRTIQKFENLCSPMDNLIRKNYEENTRLAAIRDALLPKLMSGEIDVSNVDISALTSTDKLSFRCRSPPKNISYRFSRYFPLGSVICDIFIRSFVEFFPYFCTFSALFTGYNVISKHSLCCVNQIERTLQ